ncbi:bifunctional glutamate N-acetyltransferase/amino-acid acetyltransferase ArgJ [Paraliomyxa miuraensis]|uniref:bifunctional glutamate N-acetyltransferase/amino-acid acetyltransferase ArgJ n=1 Tax=Paraliomyxa miuraensis TaxID=376150 RepID=UPI0022511A2E|nr:bifunctional glutamate N-acetyltransferase/amino-acid acetyltransferase ArgJ [Paraliomyxa miuraensis]MCX4239876.1 bifunctional glutamate N-acetyltransferase/amino-acid acetyltransferase ArgJ [Paraliomyxa miuraensis]
MTVPPVSTVLDDTVTLPRGFRFGAVRCGIKQGRADLGIIRSERPASAAGTFTQNPARAACVERDASLLPSREVVAVVVNSGNANAMTGREGEQGNAEVASEAATALGVTGSAVLTMSTGIIGVPLPADLVVRALPTLLDESGPDPMGFAAAILTTDTVTKVASVSLTLPGTTEPVHLLGIAKGSGMIHPNMATTLGFVCTDASVAPDVLQRMLRAGVEDTFNGICVDGDTSTNDSVVVLANGASDIHVDDPETEAAFEAALHAVLASLARQVVLDGEGATRLMEVEVKGAPDAKTARLIGRGVCRSSLVKCSAFAGEPNWGRIAAAAGQVVLEHGLAIDPRTMTIEAQGIELYSAQGPSVGVRIAEVNRRMRDTTVRWTLDLHAGDARYLALGCDLSYDYVRINADDAPQIEVGHDGVVRRNLSLAAYSPRLKHQLLVDGLAYVRRFMGLRMMVYVPPQQEVSGMIENLAQDLELCLDANLRPLLVVPSETLAQGIHDHMQGTGHYSAPVAPDPSSINRLLDRGHLCVLVRDRPVPHAVVDLAIKLGMHKLIAMGAEQGLRDAHGFVQRLSPESFLMGLERDRFSTVNPDLLVLAKHAATRGVPALHLVDVRLPHALVGELFTDEGIGTLITRQAIG